MTTTTDQATTIAEPHPMRWTTAMFYAAAESGVFDDRHIELIEGEIIAMSPMSSKHAIMIYKVQKALEKIFAEGYIVLPQAPLDLGDISEPQPDIAVYSGSDEDYMEQKPTHALLVVEVADSSLRYDRGKKASLYAKAGMQDYWIVNLKENVVEVYRNPVEDANQAYGYGYQAYTILTRQDLVSPLALPAAPIPTASLLP